MNFIVVSAASLAILVVVHGITFLIGRRIGRYNVVDVAWGVGFVAVAAVAAAVGTGDLFRRVLLLILVAVWGLRLAWHMIVKSAGKGEDPRYRDLLRGDFSAGHVLRKVFVVQAAATWFVSLPLQVSAVLGPTPPLLLPVLIAGVVLWVVGVLFEAVGDHQLRRFKADPANKGVIMDRGLWAWTRHPNYFGDACVWWGLWLASIAAWVSLLTVLSPVLMTYFLVYATGAKLTEKYMRNRPGFAEYRSRTSFFVPTAAQIAITVTILAPVARLPLVTTDLDALLRQVARRDVDAFATFYDRTRARVFGLVTRVLRDPGYSEETTQDIYLQVWRTADSYDPSAGSPLAWLLTLAHRRAVDRVRSEQAASQRESRYGAANVDPPSDQVADSVILRDERRQVADCLDSLTDAQRECIQLAYYDGLTYAQVSERLSANLATIKSRMRDAIRGLRRCLGLA